MNLKQKLYDLKNQKQQAIEEAKAFLLGGGDAACEEYKEKAAKVSSFDAQIAAVEALIAEEEKGLKPTDGLPVPPAGDPTKKTFGAGVLKGLTEDTVKTFAQGVRKTLKAMTEGTAADGGYTVPEDVVNRIYELIEVEDNMLPYITNTPVTTNSGKRTYKTRKQKSGFQTVAEAAAIPAQEQMTFAQISYTIAKRAGYLPVTEELLEDSDENIASLVIEWLVDEARVTINKKVAALITYGAPESIDGLDGILDILTVGLGGAIRAISTIHTNDSGLLWLLTQKDQNGRSLLNPDPTQPTRMLLSVGALTVPIKVWDNSTLPNTAAGKIPFVIGSLKEGIERFDRRSITITRLTEATVGSINLAEQDMVAFKATMRDDYQVRDAAAFVYAAVTPASGAKLVSIAVTTAPTKTSYSEDDDFDPTGMVVTATYDDSSTKNVTEDIQIFGGDEMATSVTEVTIAYTEGGVIAMTTQAVSVS